MKEHKKTRFPIPCRAARAVLHIQLPLLTVASVAFLCSYLAERSIDPLLANARYAASLEYLLASLCLSLLSALVAQVLEWDREIHAG